MSEPGVAFIIVCWNNEQLLEECFQSIKNQTYKNHRVVMVDNDSSDSSVETAKRLLPSATVIESGANFGFAKGNNIGIEEAFKDTEVKYIVLLNTDAVLSDDWVETMVSFAERKPRAACLQGTTFDYYDHNVIDSTHIFVARNGQGTQGSWRDVFEGDIGPKKVFGVNAAACLITRRFIEAQPFKKLFDEAMFMYLEDVDVAARATVMGWDNYLVPGAQAYHMGSASSGKNPGFSLYMTFRNNSAMLFKNFPLTMLLRMAPRLIRGDMDTVRVLKERGDHQAAKKVIKGRLVGLCRTPLYSWKKIVMWRNRKTPKKYIWLLMDKGY